MNSHSSWVGVCPASAEQVTSINTSMEQSDRKLPMLSDLDRTPPHSRGCSVHPSGFSPASQRKVPIPHPLLSSWLRKPLQNSQKSSDHAWDCSQLQWSCTGWPDSVPEDHCLSTCYSHIHLCNPAVSCGALCNLSASHTVIMSINLSCHIQGLANSPVICLQL